MTRSEKPIHRVHSVHDRLLVVAKERNRLFNELLQYFAMERFLYRLGQSPASRHFVLKGALLLTAHANLPFRPTRDIDLMGWSDNSEASVRKLLQSACLHAVSDDGMRFDAESMKTERIKEDADYAGVRARFSGYLGRARIAMQVDVGFGDVITPAPTLIDYPVLLGMPRPRLRAYPVETAIAEKLQAMVFLGELNSRMKDFLDVWLLFSNTALDPGLLQEAISATFAHRRTDIPNNPVCFSKEFAKAKQAQWTAMLRKNPIHSVPQDFASTLEEIQAVVIPIFSRLTRTGKRCDGV